MNLKITTTALMTLSLALAACSGAPNPGGTETGSGDALSAEDGTSLDPSGSWEIGHAMSMGFLAEGVDVELGPREVKSECKLVVIEESRDVARVIHTGSDLPSSFAVSTTSIPADAVAYLGSTVDCSWIPNDVLTGTVYESEAPQGSLALPETMHLEQGQVLFLEYEAENTTEEIVNAGVSVVLSAI